MAVCEAAGEDLSEAMVEAGWAIAYRRYSADDIGAESEAEAAGRGLWGMVFMESEKWRRSQ